jgi:hypothetical protein
MLRKMFVTREEGVAIRGGNIETDHGNEEKLHVCQDSGVGAREGCCTTRRLELPSP